MKINRIFSAILAILFAYAMVVSALALTTAEKEQIYADAIGQLEVILESSPEDAWKLDAVAEKFESLENYQNAQMLKYYVSVLIKVRDGEYDVRLDFYLNSMKGNERFISYLNDLEESSIYNVSELENYVLGRKAQSLGNVEDAIRYYGNCNAFYDSTSRMEKLMEGAIEDKYNRAEELFDAEEMTEAYALFVAMTGYKESDAYISYILSYIGYDPLHEHEWKETGCTTPMAYPLAKRNLTRLLS